ncbi:gephyrin-like molybdotransferase Glp [Geojedonia litorea]|uniref:Molybdopterin molybdenumtransferase n=1 Tax=Geojedonia litorea TaxID=1268269 RepID=A0ABV9N1E9_9FLAO
MISVEQAIDIVRINTKPIAAFELKKVKDAYGDILFEDVLSPINMPPFRQSAMDGYALHLNGSDSYRIIGEVKAGDGHHPILKPGEAIRIFTGAPVPDTANALVMQEKTAVDDTRLKLKSEVVQNENIRPLGEQVLKGQTALNKGTHLTAAAIAFLTSLGITDIKVYKKPTIAVVVTGNELVEAGQHLAYGQIYESNATMLSAALKCLEYNNVSIHKVSDDYKSTLHLLNQVISDYDVILISGGISVGDYDFVEKALDEIGVEQLFYKVNQKPGKPLFFGKKESKTVFALPGNPAAALSCFYVYVYPALQKMRGHLDFSLTKAKAISKSNFTINVNRAQFLKAIYTNGEVEILDGQNSSMLHTFALANALAYVPETSGSIKINDMVEVILFPIN